MNKLSSAFAAAITAAALLLLITPGAPTEAAPNNGVLVDVIIGFDSAPGASEEALVRGLGGQITHRYTIIPGMAASIPEAAIAALRNNPNVAAVDLDGEAHVIVTELENSWGVTRIGSGLVHGSNTGAGVKLAVIDTGIGNGNFGVGVAHEDLTVLGGWDFVGDDGLPEDGYGHGTHVSGSACALSNGFGVVGVAPDCALYNLRVLNNNGSGSWSDILAAVNWAADGTFMSSHETMDVVNLSLGGAQYPGSIVESGFNNAAAGGLTIVAAAGNSGRRNGNGDNVRYPARFDGVIAVAATNFNDVRASFSSTGPDVEISAPGVGVNSTVPSGSCTMCTSSGYRTANGTSMAAPHVAGVVALMIAAGITDIRGELSATAKPLGNAWQYGAGLVYAPDAVAGGTTPVPLPDPIVGSISGVVTVDGVVGIAATVTTDSGEFADTDPTTGEYTITNVPIGVRTVTAQADGYVDSAPRGVTVEDGIETTAVDFVLAAVVVEPPPDPGTLAVTSIDYSKTGGKNNDRHLVISVLVEDGSGAIEGVTVSVTVYRDNKEYGSATATTGTDGRASFRASNAPSGDYRTDVTSLNGGPNLDWPDEIVVYEK